MSVAEQEIMTNYQHPLRPCIKVTRVNGRGYEGTRMRREGVAYVTRLALTFNDEQTIRN